LSLPEVKLKIWFCGGMKPALEQSDERTVHELEENYIMIGNSAQVIVSQSIKSIAVLK
jgi:hypothetical protein